MYELQRGRLAEAGRMADASLQDVPDYAAALLARGRIQLAQKKPVDAVETLTRAARLNPLPEYQWALADALRLLNRTDEAAALESSWCGRASTADPRTLALYLSTRRQGGRKAVDLARRELEKRADVFTLDALAWALASSGQVRGGIDAHGPGARRRHRGRPPVPPCRRDRRRRRPSRRRRALGAARREALRFTLLPSELGVLRRGIATPPHA